MCKREAMLIRNMLKEVCTWPLIQCMALRAPGILATVLKRSAVVVVVAALCLCRQRLRNVAVAALERR